MEINFKHIAEAYGLDTQSLVNQPIGNGLINETFLLIVGRPEQRYILQQINHQVFKQPEIIARNTTLVAEYLRTHAPHYLFIRPIQTLTGEDLLFVDGQYWRLLPYVAHSLSLDVLSTTEQAYEAAQQFGRLSFLLKDFKVDTLGYPILDFHNLKLRYTQFQQALEQAATARKHLAKEAILDAQNYKYLVDYYQSYLKRSDFPDRVIHHDTKISNVLLDERSHKGICVIDLDTMMPGKFISDLGDMMRTYLCAYDENEVDLSKIEVRVNFFEALVKGYLSEMKACLTETEQELIVFSGKYMIYMQALRFLTDFLNEDVYYPIKYAQQNLDRSQNQFQLLKSYNRQEVDFNILVEKSLL